MHVQGLFSMLSQTGVVKKIGSMLRELAPAARGPRDHLYYHSCTELCRNIPAKFQNLPQLGETFQQPFQEPGRNVFTRLCSITTDSKKPTMYFSLHSGTPQARMGYSHTLS